VPPVDADEARLTLSHLDSDGSSLRVVHDRVAVVTSSPDGETSRATADALNSEAPANDVHEQATVVVDPVVREGIFLEARLLAQVLSACDAPDGEVLQQLEDAHPLVADRLVELEEAA
jgi:hypothetical protein